MQFLSTKFFKNRKNKLLNTNSLKLTSTNYLSDRGLRFLALENGHISKTDKKVSKTLKIADFIKKTQKIETLKR